MPPVTSSDGDLRRSPLHTRHVALDAVLGPFGGWTMPISYPDGGVLAEHTAVRDAVGVFDVSHLGTASITGPAAVAFANRCFTNDLERIGDGQAQYTLCCAEDGGVLDDLIAYRVRDDELLVMPNAANAATVLERLTAAAPDGVRVTDRHSELAVLAVQGPHSAAVLDAVGLPTELDYMAFQDVSIESAGLTSQVSAGGGPVRVCRTGYTGEHGYELVLDADAAPPLWDRLLVAAQARGGRACGLGARDTLRTELGYPLHGQDLSPEITPVQARCGWAVGWDKPEFWGRDALLAERRDGPGRRLTGLRATGRGVPRPGMTVLAGGTPVGSTTSGTFSPTLRAGIALALLDTSAGLKKGDVVSVDVRGRALECVVQPPPFVPSHVR
ncbi:MAG: aminomethyltransferase [Pseudonocardiales bacterium]|nr:aminomethyltransferase [Pseudonocardiales bacterium]